MTAMTIMTAILMTVTPVMTAMTAMLMTVTTVMTVEPVDVRRSVTAMAAVTALTGHMSEMTHTCI
jgi:hypothetical protein